MNDHRLDCGCRTCNEDRLRRIRKVIAADPGREGPTHERFREALRQEQERIIGQLQAEADKDGAP